jgi:hypothetical protein
MEVLLSLVMLVVLTLAATSLYGFCVTRVMTDTTMNSVQTQASNLADEISRVIGNSKACTLAVSGSVTGLKCTMPDSGLDKNGDGVLDQINPTSVDPSGTETFGTGKYVWFYMSDTTGAWGTVGTFVWRAKPLTSANPVPGDLDTAWAKYYGSAGRWNFIDSISYSNDATNHCTTFTINASSLNRAERTAAGETSTSNNSKLTITRTVFWRNYR